MLRGSGQQGLMSVVYGAIVVAIMAVFIIQFRPSATRRTAPLQLQCVVNVRDRCIDPKEFWASHSLVVPRGVEEHQLKRMGVRRQVIEGLLERTLLVQDADRLKLTVSDEDVNREIVNGRVHVSLPVMHASILAHNLGLTDDLVRYLPFHSPESKTFDYAVYRRVIRTQTNRSEKEFKEMQRQELIAARMRDLVRSRARIGDEEAFSIYQREKATAVISYVPLRKTLFASLYLDTSPKAVAAWMDEHKAEVDKSWGDREDTFPAGCRRARHILIKIRTETQPGGHEREEAQRTIEKVFERLQAGEDFALVAGQASEDEGSAPRGGDLGCFVKGKMVKAFEDAVFSLKNPGDLSSIVETPFGFHLVKLEAVLSENATAAEAQGRELVATDVMVAMQSEQLVSDTAKRVRETMLAGKSMEQAVDEQLAVLDARAAKRARHKPPQDTKTSKGKGEPSGSNSMRPKVETTQPFTIDSRPIPDAAPNQNVAALVFKLAVPGEVGNDLMRLEDGYAVYQLNDRVSATREQYDAERDAFIAKLLRRKAQDLLGEYVSRLRAQVRTETRVNETWAKEPEKDQGDGDGD